VVLAAARHQGRRLAMYTAVLREARVPEMAAAASA
jgi:hypothetical protein